ncbi:MAG: hypothetical protein MZV63_06835 [Marinilabiliales bacterium]|nr:hypothetical protein [Marinilabiliales bacterium]
MTPRRPGQISGQIYAISTLGSFIGTFLPTLVIIPTIGTKLTFFSFGIVPADRRAGWAWPDSPVDAKCSS